MNIDVPQAWRDRLSSRTFIAAWYRHYKALFFVMFFIVAAVGCWAWYYSLFLYSWTAEEKQAYTDLYSQETDFKESKFRDTLNRIDRLAESHAEPVVLSRIIFVAPKKQDTYR